MGDQPATQKIPDINIMLIDTDGNALQEIRIVPRNLGQFMWLMIPEYLRDSHVPFPEDVQTHFPWAEAIRSGFKNLIRPFMPKVLFTMYGASAPKLERHQDILPVLWKTLVDFMLIQIIQHPGIFYLKKESEDATPRYLLVAVAPFTRATNEQAAPSDDGSSRPAIAEEGGVTTE